MVSGRKRRLAVLFIASTAMAAATIKQDASLEAGRHAYEASDYVKAVKALQAAAAKDPQNADVQLLLAKSYLELQQHDAAIKSAERAVAIDAQNSIYHEWLGRAYGGKGRSRELVFGDIAREKNAQRVRDGSAAGRKEFFGAAGADRIRLQRSRSCGWR